MMPIHPITSDDDFVLGGACQVLSLKSYYFPFVISRHLS